MEADSNAYMKRLSSGFVLLRESGKLCDTVLVTADRQLLAHSIVLSAASPVFRAAFQSCTADGCLNYRLQLDGLDGRLMETILNCIYSGCVTPLNSLSCAADTKSALEICEQLGVGWMITDNKDANNPVDQVLQINSTERCKTITAGCYQQTGTEKSVSVQSSENSIDSHDPLHERCTGSVPVDYDGLIRSNNKIRKASSSLYLAADPVDPSVMEQLCPYVCDICNQKFSTGATLRRHRRHHKDCATCIACGHSFYSTTLLRHHLLMQCPRKIVACNICWISFDGWPSLSTHTSTTHPAASVCPACGQAFLHTSQLLAHRIVHATNIYQCRTCSQSFSLLSHVKRHVMKHVTDSDDGCISEGFRKEVSREGLIAESGLIQDKKDASGSLLKEVKGDAHPSGYSLSEVIKNSSVSYQQKEVNGAASVSDSLHPDPVYSPAHRSLPMSSTGYNLPAVMAASNGHIGGHGIILRFDKQTPPNCVLVAGPPEVNAAVKAGCPERVTCAECLRTFKRLSDLHVHMQCHTGEMRYKCSVCSRPFRKSGTLARHMRIHTGERPYICETCGKSYKLLFHLRLHMTVHSSDRPYPCDMCSKAFQSAASLKKHLFVHTGAKPFSCPICLRLFNRCSNMRAHMRVHSDVHQDDVFAQEHVCILCQKKFGNAASFQMHLQTHAHQIELDVGENITAVDSADSFGAAMTFCKVEKQQSDDVYVALPLVHFDDSDVS